MSRGASFLLALAVVALTMVVLLLPGCPELQGGQR